ncbi:MAG: hypothetical protein NC900_01845 [Candidatus Omnitrophica bacterium]|nr:hypothetical protein [Candidatus Omnitrophota bacterium]
MYILGIDENGLGLTNQAMLGPLVVSSVGFKIQKERFSLEIPFEFKERIRVYDSKELFKRTKKSYRLLEDTALSFLSILKGSVIDNFDLRIFKEFNIEKVPCNLEGFCFFQKPFNLPLWTEKNYLDRELKDFLNQKGIRFIYFRFILLCPKLLYNKDKYKEEAFSFAKIILDWQRTINSRRYKVLCGNIKNYSKKTVENWWKEKSFFLDSEKIEFVTRGDKEEFVMGLASILGKYIREIFIERINRYFSFCDKSVPYCSGYRHNKKFDIFIKRAKFICKKNNLDFVCLARDYNM